jgi:hypothetical protein
MLFITLPWVIGVVFIFSDSRRMDAVANRQQTARGLVTAYERSNHNQYRYTFTAQGKQYGGISQSPTDSAIVGGQIQVYFDPRDPTTNSLEDFSTRSRRDMGMLPFLALGIGGVAAFILYSKTTSPSRPNPS